MALTLPQNPLKKRPLGPFSDPQLGSPGASPGPTPSPADAVPVIQPPPGTAAGIAARSAYKSGVNDVVGALNASLAGGTAAINKLSQPLRTAAGTGVDFVRGLVGADQRPNAGQPFAPLSAPHVDVPYGAPSPASAPAAPVAAAVSAPAAAPASPTVGIVSDPRNYNPAADNISQANLATAKQFGSPPTAAAPVAQIKMPGAVINGVRTFSDGSGGIPRTMTDDQIQHAGDNLSRADKGVLGQALASDALGYTPSSEQMVQQRIAQIQQPITGSRPSAQQFADAERTDIANRDWRSAAGTAAHNLAIEAQYGGTPRLRRMAETALANLSAGAQQSGLAAQQEDAQAANTEATGRNALQAIQLQGQNALENTALVTAGKLRMPRPGRQVQLADGTLGVQDPLTGAVTTSTLPNGTVAKGQLRNPVPPIYTSAGGQAALQSLTNNILGVDPISGKIPDKNAPGGSRLPTNAETFAALQKAQSQLKQLGSGMVSSNVPASVDDFLAAARKVNPTATDAQLRAYYEKTYGSAK